jgi:hypothetical protein
VVEGEIRFAPGLWGREAPGPLLPGVDVVAKEVPIEIIERVRAALPAEARVEAYGSNVVVGHRDAENQWGVVTLLLEEREFTPGYSSTPFTAATWLDVPLRGYAGRGWLEALAKAGWTALERCNAET